MNVLLVTHYYPKHRGGIEIIAGKISELMTRHWNVQFEWMASDINPWPTLRLPRLRCTPMRTWNIAEDYFHIPYPLWSPKSLVKLWTATRRAHLVHLHDYIYLGSIIAFMAARWYKKPVVVTQHIGLIPYKNLLFRWLLAVLNGTLGHWLLKRADRVVFYSQLVNKHFSKGNPFGRRALTIYNGVDSQVYFPVKEPLRKRYRRQLGLSLHTPVFLFVGRFVEKKGLVVLRQLATDLTSVQWVFAGWGPLNPQKWGLPHVKVIRGKRGPGLSRLYQTADLLVLPSQGEGFPLVIQEAMACGTPVMIGNETAAAYQLARPVMYHAKVGDIDTAARWRIRLKTIMSQPEKLKELRPRVASFARAHWKWHSCSQHYHRLFRELIDKAHGRQGTSR